EHGVGGGIAGIGAQMAVGASMGSAMAGAMQPQFPPSPGMGGRQQPSFTPLGPQVTCAKCNTKQPGGKFGAGCGTALAQAKKFCTGCGQELGASAKFCQNCGTSASAG